MSITLDYYNENAKDFVSGTVGVDFSYIQNIFAEYMPEKAKVLDLGCGSGRDSKAFKEMGFDVTAVDGSEEVCKLAAEYTGLDIVNSTFENFEPEEEYDGIWACASLLHLTFEEIKKMMKKYAGYVKEGGCFYASFKYGDFSGERNGRFFTDINEKVFEEILDELERMKLDRQFITEDVRPEKTERWLNVVLVR